MPWLWPILLVTQLIGNKIAVALFRGNAVLMYLAYAMLYLVLALVVTALYARTVEHLSCGDLGMVKKFPGVIWLLIGLLLPLGVTGFYLLFAGGELAHSSSETALILCSVTLTSAIAGPTEEAIFRGMLMRSFQKRLGTAAGVLAPSFMFAVIHVVMMSSVTPVSFLMLLVSGTLVGVMFSLIALYSGSIWASSVVHSLWNVTIIGGILSIHAPGSGVTEAALYEYTLSSSNLFLTGGIYGIECSLPAMVGFVCVSAVVLLMMERDKG